MSLLDYEPTTRPVLVNGKELFHVSGLSTEAMSFILNLHREEILALVLWYQAGQHNIFSPQGLDAVVIKMVNSYSHLLAEVISVAGGYRSNEAAKKAAKLPFTAQSAACADILTMTFDDAGGLKNLFATLATILREMFPADVKEALLESLRQALNNEQNRQ